MSDPYEAYKVYNSLKLHFETDSYDALKYNFKTHITPQSFFKRKDKYFFAKVAKNYGKDLVHYFVSNFVRGSSYIGEMLNEGGEQNYRDHKKIRESIHRTFEVDINKLVDLGYDFDKYFISEDGQHPMIVKIWMQEEISLETIVILNSLLGFVPRESKKISETIIWPDIKRKIEKYTPFVDFNKDSCLKILKKRFT